MLEESVLDDLRGLFCEIRSHTLHEAALKSYLDIIEEKRAIINNCGNDLQKSIFIYCFDILRSSIEGQNQDLILDFADAVHNLPEIFYHNSLWGKAPLSSLKTFWKLFIQPLRKKHGKRFFEDFKHFFIQQ